jgi:hypothetical protein
MACKSSPNIHYNFEILVSLWLVLLFTYPGRQASFSLDPPEENLDFLHSVVVLPEDSTPRDKKAVALLVEEVEKRAQIRWPISPTWPEPSTPVVLVGQASTLSPLLEKLGQKVLLKREAAAPEGYQVQTEKWRGAATVCVAGNDSRGVLFGVGRLLRAFRLRRGTAILPGPLSLSTAPRYPLRGHQLGYRPKTNSYDGWSLPLWEQYIRDLAVFGTNAVELIPPRSDDDNDSPHFPVPPLQMMQGMSRLLDEYGLDVWIWYPAMDKDYSDSRTVELALAEWGEVFRKLPRIDAVFVPGGDPGHTRPRYLMALLEKEAQALRRYHPRAQMWVSPQSFNQEWLDEFYAILKSEEPAWLNGVVFGPQVRGSLPGLRASIPKKYPIRHYPDITHSRQCQYPVPDWDLAYALTEGREVINPRPLGQARIFQLFQEHTVGFITYSEGCNDDVNKIIWSALGWDPGTPVLEILRDYSRYFLGEGYADSFSEGLIQLEKNWEGPLLTNDTVDATLEKFRSLEESASPRDLLSWRFQQALYRAYYDAYTRSRLLRERSLEERAMDSLRQAASHGSIMALDQAEAVLSEPWADPTAASWRARVFELAEALFQSIRMQLSVKRYRAISIDRGANLDAIDTPLNSSAWLKARFSDLRKLASEAQRLEGIREILDWTNPGPGGFYDDLGDPARQPHLVKGLGFEKDPAFLESALVGFSEPVAGPRSWWNYAGSLQDAPLKMHYGGLDRDHGYKLRVVYAGDSPGTPIRLIAGDQWEVHPFRKKDSPVRPVEFDIPKEATAGGELDLSWYRPPGLGGNGRGCQVAEVWLIRK